VSSENVTGARQSCSVFGVEIAIAEAKRQAADGPAATALAEAFATRARQDVLRELAAAGIPAAAALTIAELFHDPQVIANDFIFQTTVPHWGEFRQTGALVKYAATPVTIQPAPQLGQHTEEILRDVLGYAPDRIEALRAAGTIICAP